MLTLPVEYLRSLFRYDKDTGKLYWLKSGRGRNFGKEAGTVVQGCNTLYRQVCINGRVFLVHRIVWAMEYGNFPTGEVDHEDHNGLNNKIDNLKDVAHIQNQQNKTLTTRSTSGCMGVTWTKKDRCWRARIKVKQKEIHLGHFTSFDEAVKARKAAETFYGFHSNHGTNVQMR